MDTKLRPHREGEHLCLPRKHQGGGHAHSWNCDTLGLGVPICSLVATQQCSRRRTGTEEEHPDLSWWPDKFSLVVPRAPAPAARSSQPDGNRRPALYPEGMGSSGRDGAHGTAPPLKAEKADAEEKPTGPGTGQRLTSSLC